MSTHNIARPMAAFLLATAVMTATSPGALAQQPAPGAPPPADWVAAGSPVPAQFPQPPGAQSAVEAAFPPSNNNANDYAVQTTQQAGGVTGQDGMANLTPLTPPPKTSLEAVRSSVAPLTPGQVQAVRDELDVFRKATSKPTYQTSPVVRTASVDLRPGAAVPIVRTLMTEPSTVVFLDATGATWPLAVTPRVGDSRLFDVEWLKGTHSLVISTKTAYGQSGLAVFLQGLGTPVMVRLVSGEADTNPAIREVDYRVDIRVPGRGPNATEVAMGDRQISIYDDVLQRFLDGVPPEGAHRLAVQAQSATPVQAWEHGGLLYIRTALDSRTAVRDSMASADGTRIYRMSPTPYVMLSEQGNTVSVRVELN